MKRALTYQCVGDTILEVANSFKKKSGVDLNTLHFSFDIISMSTRAGGMHITVWNHKNSGFNEKEAL